MKKVCLTVLSLFTVLFFISCGSKPAPEEPKPKAPEVSEVIENAVEDVADNSLAEAAKLAQLMEQVNDARKAGTLAVGTNGLLNTNKVGASVLKNTFYGK